MATIPKKVAERFAKATPKFQKVLQIARDRDVNESDTVAILNDVFGEVFGYDKYIEVTSEYAIRSTFCDLALKVDGKVQFLVEAKAVGIELKDNHVKQAIDYGANEGIQWVVLTNGIDWRVYRIRFEKPINFDLVCRIDFTEINGRNSKDQELLFLLSKEGLQKGARDEYYDRVQSVNRYVIGNLLISGPVLSVVRRELKRLADGMKIEIDEVEHIIRAEVLKREIVQGEDAESAAKRVKRFYKKAAIAKSAGKKATTTSNPDPVPQESVTERLLREAESDESDSTGS